MSYNNNWVNELKESYIEEKKAMNFVKKGAKVVAKGAKEAGKSVVNALGTRGGSSEAMHLGRGGTYDHVEHEGNNLQEEVALNEDLLMLIDILCEELGIDVETLLEDVFDAKGAAASVASVNRLADIATLKSDSPNQSGAGKAMNAWSKAYDRNKTRAGSKTPYTAKGGRVVIKKPKK